ncbi:MAG: DUF5329 domain-containing protein [Rhodanobacteraceae bacterium]
MRFFPFAFVVSLLCAGPCAAAELSSASRAEINALLDRLGTSGCQFNRNGSWYESEKAKSHLARKLDYLLDRKLVESPEQFIELAGSKSSRSGKTYLVKCGKEEAVPSATWLTDQLRDIRAKGPEPAKP